MLRLRTFGGLTLSRGHENLTGAITQRRRLAILALLAVSHDTGMSRDKLVAYLWPESDAERARHVLNQLLYAQRRQVEGDAIFIGRKTLRLNPKLISSDVAEFEEAMRREALAEGVGLYTGSFLDGFFLKDAPEFERWVDSQRERLARRVSPARRSSGGAAPPSSTRWSRMSRSRWRALAAGGDRSGALRHARQHAAALESQLGVSPDPRLAELLADLGHR